MSNFKGKFELYASTRMNGFNFYSFILKCTKWFGSETVDCMISFQNNPTPWYWRSKRFEAGRSYAFNYDTVDWQWYNHDFFAILDKKGNIAQKWELNLKEYGPGECPDCHGTHVCKYCHGQALSFNPSHYMEGIQTCKYCGGTGICQKCNIPIRKSGMGEPPTGIGNGYK